MTKEQKDLLLHDLCARLPYKTEIQVNDYAVLNTTLKVGHISRLLNEDLEIKPYLFPLESMTEEQDKEFALLQTSAGQEGFLYVWNCANMMKWLIENHFDYNGLIPMGLANDATGKNIY